MKKRIDRYNNYFRHQYGLNYSDLDLDNYYNWFYSQWEFIKNKVKFIKNLSVLEVGSGIGGLYQFLEKDLENVEYVGLELDGFAVEFARWKFKNANFKKSAFEEYFSKNNFNYIFAFEVLEHIEEPIQAIKKIYQLLKKRGVFIGTTPYPYAKNVHADPTHLYVLHPDNWKKLFYENGFSSVEIFPMTFLPFIWRINKYLNIRIPFYLPIKYIISTSLIIAKK